MWCLCRLTDMSATCFGPHRAFMLKILIADDSEVMRKIVRSLLSEVQGWSVCGEADNGQQAILLAQELKPDLIVLDLAMPLLDGLRASAEIVKFAPLVPIVLYTLHKTPEIELEAKKAGAKSVVSKSDDPQALVETLKKAAAESTAASPIEAMKENLFNAIPAQASGYAPDPQRSAEELAGTRQASFTAAAAAQSNGSAAMPSSANPESGSSDPASPAAEKSQVS
jgi:two-component system, chemotaxis family, chemotaxis protein CheY